MKECLVYASNQFQLEKKITAYDVIKFRYAICHIFRHSLRLSDIDFGSYEIPMRDISHPGHLGPSQTQCVMRNAFLTNSIYSVYFIKKKKNLYNLLKTT